jgi:hypothetical protein
LFSVLFTSYVTAQDNEVSEKIVVEKDPAKLRFGLMGFSSVGWLAPENDLLLTRGKVGLGFGWGLNTEILINKTTSFRTGLSLSTFNASLNYNDSEKNQSEYFTNTYFVANKATFQKWENDTELPYGELRKLSIRKYKLSYVNIPLILKLKTKEIGYLTYFGEFGGLIGIKTKAKVLDEFYDVNLNPDSIIDNIGDEPTNTVDFDFEDGAQLIRAGVCLGAGAEYNFSGSTSLFFQVNWNYFMTNMMRKEEKDDYLRSFDSNSGNYERVNSKSIPGSITITVGILF